MGAIISKLCYCKGKRRRHHSNSQQQPTKLSKNPSLIIERTQFLRDEDGISEYSRVLEKDFEIKGRKVVGKSQFNHERTAVGFDYNLNINRSDSIIKVKHTHSHASAQRLIIFKTLCRPSKLNTRKVANYSPSPE